MFMKTQIKRQADKKKRAGRHTKTAGRGALLFCHKWNAIIYVLGYSEKIDSNFKLSNERSGDVLY